MVPPSHDSNPHALENLAALLRAPEVDYSVAECLELFVEAVGVDPCCDGMYGGELEAPGIRHRGGSEMLSDALLVVELHKHRSVVVDVEPPPVDGGNLAAHYVDGVLVPVRHLDRLQFDVVDGRPLPHSLCSAHPSLH